MYIKRLFFIIVFCVFLVGCKGRDPVGCEIDKIFGNGQSDEVAEEVLESSSISGGGIKNDPRIQKGDVQLK